MWDIWANQLLPKALKSCSKSNKSPNLVTLFTTEGQFVPFSIGVVKKKIRIIKFFIAPFNYVPTQAGRYRLLRLIVQKPTFLKRTFVAPLVIGKACIYIVSKI